MSKYRRNEVDVVDAIQVNFDTTREELRAFDKHVMVSPDWNGGFDCWIMLPSGEREFCYGDWIVRNEHGDLWFSADGVFAGEFSLDTLAPYIEAMNKQAATWGEVFRIAAGLTDSDFRKEDVTVAFPATDLTPYITDMNEAVADLARNSIAISTDPDRARTIIGRADFGFRKDIYLGGGADFRDTDFRDIGYTDEVAAA